MNTDFFIRVAGISIRFVLPMPMEVPEDLKPFLTEPDAPDETYTIELIQSPLTFSQPPVYRSGILIVYREDGGWTYAKPGLSTDNGAMAACRVRNNGQHTLYVPAEAVQRCWQRRVFSGLLAPEFLLQRHDGFLLHSSVVEHRGRVVLMCGPSGVGKSTQAALWEQCLGAKILNGDRCAVTKRRGVYWGSGSPYCGSSGICCRDEAPIAGILLLGQAPENSIRETPAKESLRTLYRETILNTWDAAFVEKQLSLISELIQTVPIYTLKCRPDTDAVFLAEQTLFGGEISK